MHESTMAKQPLRTTTCTKGYLFEDQYKPTLVQTWHVCNKK